MTFPTLQKFLSNVQSLSQFSQAHLNKIALRLNKRPRKTLGFDTRAGRMNAASR